MLIYFFVVVFHMVMMKTRLGGDLKTGERENPSYYNFVNLILMIVILTSFEAVNYAISISCFLLAIAGIVVGFRFEYKALRLFGLILSMISTFKLIMVDISYENTLGNALSFFASGILCFVISMIYSMIDGKIGRDRK